MRRTDREVTNPAEITEMMTRCEVLHLALNTDTVPYILPVNFGMEPDGMTLYIHGAREGTKYALIEKDNRAGFELTVPTVWFWKMGCAPSTTKASSAGLSGGRD